MRTDRGVGRRDDPGKLGRGKRKREKEGKKERERLVGSKNSSEFAMGQGYQEFRCPSPLFFLSFHVQFPLFSFSPI
ncbi:hypothetical protein TNCV_3735421 [Trichonephila clavipes]|nr:hypothetical protein TNCV_3735421 [Trichonephila clavipes]